MRPRIGFLGLGWIGQARLRALIDADVVDVTAVADPRRESVMRVATDIPDARVCSSMEDLLEARLDGVVIATPSALHANQTIACLKHGVAVFCQKPLARSAEEAARVVQAARAVDRRLDVDMSYRHTASGLALKRLVDEGVLGRVHAADLVFHNAYGPDQSWYYARGLSGGGCLMDLGVHLFDQITWLLGWSEVRVVDARLLVQGRAWNPASDEVEDFAHVVLEGPDAAVARVTCSWRASVGCDARIAVELLGTSGGAGLSNVNGSFYDFTVQQWIGTSARTIVEPPDAWGGRALIHWARALASGNRSYDPAAEEQIAVSGIIDRVYASAAQRPRQADVRPQPLETR